MANSLVKSSNGAYLTHIGAGNSFFTGNTEAEQGNIRSTVGASSPQEIYSDTAAMNWSGGVEAGASPTNIETGQFAVVETLTAVNTLGADYSCARGGSVITTGGKIQLAISTNNGTPIEGGNDARWCLYYPSEDFNQEVLAHEYITSDPNDVNQGNNVSELLANITGRMKNFIGNDGPVCNGTINNDLLNDTTSIFRKGCILTWENANTAGNALVIAAGV
tara:strand:+ start:42 stop:701 length:660 start_codon:yes stop_codon:yes gene_type:complete